MDFKVEISCAKCKCSFELRPPDFKHRPYMECPNCGQELPAEIYENLKAGVVSLGEIPEFSDSENTIFHEIGFSLRAKAYTGIPSLDSQS